MTDQQNTDQGLLTDFLRGECDDSTAREVRRRLESDAEFRQAHDDLANALAALELAPEIEPPADLVERTLWRVSSAGRTNELLAREQARPRGIAPTFSFRELVGLAAAVFLLAVILVPSLQQARNVRIAGLCGSNVGQIGRALQSFATDNDGQLPSACRTRTRWLPGQGELAVSNSAGLFRLVRDGYESPMVFQCPGVRRGTFVVSAGMVDFPAGDYVGYSYQHSLGPNAPNISAPELADKAHQMVILADSSPVFADGRFQSDRLGAAAGDNHRGRGQNVLYLDMHVQWVTRADVGVDGDNIFLVEGVWDYRGTERPTSRADTFLLPAYSGNCDSR